MAKRDDREYRATNLPSAAALSRRDRILVSACIVLITALAWAYLVHLDRQMSSAMEPIGPADKGKPHKFKLTRHEDTIEFRVNDVQVHAWTEGGQYPHYKEPLRGGCMAFRNFTGFADDFYCSIVVREI